MAINVNGKFGILVLDAADDIMAGVRPLIENIIDAVETCGGEPIIALQAAPLGLIAAAAHFVTLCDDENEKPIISKEEFLALAAAAYDQAGEE